MRISAISLFFLFFTALGESLAQGFNPYPYENESKPNPIRWFLSRFELDVSSGYNLSLYTHGLEGVSLTKHLDYLYFVKNQYHHESGEPVFSTINLGVSNWVYRPRASIFNIRDHEDFIINTDTAAFNYRALGSGIPVNVNLTFSYRFLRLGAGASFELHRIGTFKPSEYAHIVPEFQMEHRDTYMTRFYGIVGARVWDFHDYSFIVDVHLGKYNLGSPFNESNIHYSMFYNGGIVIEKNYSEYFKVFARAAYESKNYTLPLFDTNMSIEHKIPALLFNIGVKVRYPEIGRCTNNACHVRMVHKHGNKQYRGQPFYKKQNSGYGEFQPNLLKHGHKNKRIRNPF